MTPHTIEINRAPVLTLWAAVVAERTGYEWPEALTLGKVLAGLNAQSKGRMLGIFGPPKGAKHGRPQKVGLGEEFWVELCGRGVPAKSTADGVRGVVKDQAVDPDKVASYLAGKFGDDLDAARAAMSDLAAAFDPADLADAAYGLYEQFRPKIAPGKRGWGQKGTLDLDFVRSLASRD
jgi:hypothetical protein